ncbi:unannotated protein [freshwater metagenome]|jgi:hypothetical protein|uniref:Unannotated protein n=1 Tax=freshwater metagenome TaxID=449393 RepID=A0A6J7NTZ1_9ZZZZ
MTDALEDLATAMFTSAKLALVVRPEGEVSA